MSAPRKRLMSSAKAMRFDDDTLDRADSAYQAESLRWCTRCKLSKRGYELFRNGSKNGIDEARDPADDTIINLTLREAPNYDRAEEWLDAYRGRAAMKAALEAL